MSVANGIVQSQIIASSKPSHPKASSSTSIQCFTGVVVPVCRCWMQPMLADTITCGASGARFASLRSRSA